MTIEELNLIETTDTPILQGFKVYSNKNNPIKINLINYDGLWIQADQRGDNKYYFNIYYQSEPLYYNYNAHQIGVENINPPRRFSIPNQKKILEWLEFIKTKHIAFLKAIELSKSKKEKAINEIKELENVINSKATHYTSGINEVYSISTNLFNVSIFINMNTGDYFSKIRFEGDVIDLITFLKIKDDKRNQTNQ